MSRYWEFRWFHNRLPQPSIIKPKHLHAILTSCNISELYWSEKRDNHWENERFEFPSWIEYLDLSYNTIYDFYEGESTDYPLPDSLKLFNVARNKLTFLPDYLPPRLETLMARGNMIERLPRVLPESLERIQLSYNRLTSWSPTVKLPKLRQLGLSNNRLQKVTSLGDNVTYVHLGDNQLQKLEIDKFPETLEKLELQNNFLNEIPELPPQIVYLDVTNNRFQKLSNFPSTLEVLYCGKNQLEEWDEHGLMECKNLRDLDYQGNPNLEVSGAFLDWIEVQFRHLYETGERDKQVDAIRKGNRSNFRTVYDNPQNVHLFEDNLVTSCERLIHGHPEWDSWLPKSQEELLEEAASWGIPQDVCLLIKEEWGMSSAESKIRETLGELWCAVWVRLRRMRRKEREPVLTILTHEVREVHNVCFTGRVGRILTILQGFDEAVQIVLPISEQILGRLHVLRTKLEEYPFAEDTIPYLWELECMFSVELMDLKLSLEERENWLIPIREEIVEGIERIGGENWEEFMKNWKPLGNDKKKEIFVERYFNEIEKMKLFTKKEN